MFHGEAAELTFEPFGSYVYMVINSCAQQFGTMWSETNNIGWWADKDVSFCVPVKVYQQNGNRRQLISLATIVPFAYANSSRAVITDREVNGRNAAKAIITCPPDAWLGPRGPASSRKMLELQTQVFPALNAGQRSEMRTLIELEVQDSDEVGETSQRMMRTRARITGERWGKVLAYEGERLRRISKTKECMQTSALALELMTRENAFNVIYLKQYRDADDPDLFCYQAYINAVRHVHSVMEAQDLTDNVIIRLHKYPDHNIQGALGLKCQRMDSMGDSVVFVLEPSRPFWMRVQLNEELSQVLCSRTNIDELGDRDGVWRTDHPWFRRRNPPGWVTKNEKDEPFFRGNGRTSTGPNLWKHIQDTLNGTNYEKGSVWPSKTQASAEAWLRDALLSELKAMAVSRLKSKRPTSRLSKPTKTELVNANWRLVPMAQAKSTGDLFWFVEELHYALETKGAGRRNDNNRRRFTRRQAGSLVDRLEDVKAVIDSLLYEGAKALGDAS